MRIHVLAAVATVGLVVGVAPAALAASIPGKPAAVAVKSGNKAYTVSWSAAASNGSPIKGYQVLDRVRRTSSWSAWVTRTVGASVRSKSIGGVNGSLHQTTVRAYNARGFGAWSSVLSVRVGLPGVVPAVIAVDGLKTSAKKVAFSLRPAASNGTTIKAYQVLLRRKTVTSWSAWTVKSAGTSVNTYYFKGLTAGVYQGAVRAINARGAGPVSALATAFRPKITVLTAGPLSGGQSVQVRVTGFPYDQPNISLGVCANDGRALQSPSDCATGASGGFKYPLVVSYGSVTTTLKLPTGALGNGTPPAVTCGGGANAGKCAFIADSINEFFETPAVPVNYADPQVTLPPGAPFTTGSSIKASFTGFPATDTQLEVAICRGDAPPTGPGDCAPLGPPAGGQPFSDGPANKIVTPKGGAGSSTLAIPTGLLGATNAPTYDCKTSTFGCIVLVSNFTGTSIAYAVLSVANPSVSLDAATYNPGDTIHATFSAFPGSVTPVEVAICRGDAAVTGPGDCAPLGPPAGGQPFSDGPANKIVSPTLGGGTADLVIPNGVLGASNAPTYDCKTSAGGCIVLVSSFDGLTFAYQPLVFAP